MIGLLAATALGIATFALAMTLANCAVYRRSLRSAPLPVEPPSVSVCVPARNEESNIEACVRSLLAQDWPELEVVVYDDGSTDLTPRILASLAEEDDRVTLARTTPLPEGWNGKQHACWRMSQQARGEWMLFTDADVRFESDAVRRAMHETARCKADLLSTFPRQVTRTLSECAVVPMIFFVLFSYLPMLMMRMRPSPPLSAGCGQFLLVSRRAYDALGGHAAFKDTMHDGIRMPRAARSAGFQTDLFDGSDLCAVRMYRGFGEVWRGFAKNAYEGLGSPVLLVVFTVLHLVGHLVPWAIVLAWAAAPETVGGRPAAIASLAIGVAILQRLILAARTRHTALAAPLHPVGVALMTAIQWWSLVLQLTGRRSWRGRVSGKPA